MICSEAFDRQLRASDAAWGLRDMEAVVALAGAVGFELTEIIEMPANNFIVMFQRGSQSGNAPFERSPDVGSLN